MGSGSIRNTNVACAFLAEALACLQVLIFVKEMGSSQVVVEGDARTVIMKASKGVVDRSAIGIFMADIKLMAINFNSVLFQHVNQDANAIAHSIARKGFELLVRRRTSRCGCDGGLRTEGATTSDRC